MEQVNIIGGLIGGIAAFILGGLWYSPLICGNAWAAASGLSEEQIKSASVGAMVTRSLPLSIIAALVFAAFLGRDIDLAFGTAAGLAAGLCWVTASLGINYVFEQKSLKLFLVNGGYHTLQFVLYGAIIGATNTVF